MISDLSHTEIETVTGGHSGFSVDIYKSFNTGGTTVYGSVNVSSYKAGGNTVLIGSSGGLNVSVLF